MPDKKKNITEKCSDSGNGDVEENPESFKITLEIPHLEPLTPLRPAPHPVPKIVLREDGTDITDEQLPFSIPDTPLHLCPNCDYNLTSLRTRRCPECGELFDPIEAKRHGARTLPHVRQDLRAVFINNISLVGGISLFATSFGIGRWLLHGQRGGWGAWLAFIAVLILVVAMMYKIYYQRTLAEAILFAGIVATATVGMIVIVLG